MAEGASLNVMREGGCSSMWVKTLKIETQFHPTILRNLPPPTRAHNNNYFATKITS